MAILIIFQLATRPQNGVLESSNPIAPFCGIVPIERWTIETVPYDHKWAGENVFYTEICYQNHWSDYWSSVWSSKRGSTTKRSHWGRRYYWLKQSVSERPANARPSSSELRLVIDRFRNRWLAQFNSANHNTTSSITLNLLVLQLANSNHASQWFRTLEKDP